MSRCFRLLFLTLLSGSSAASVGAEPQGKLVPVNFSDVTIAPGFWADRQDVNRRVSIPHNLDTCEETGRIRNFAQAAGIDSSPFGGHYFHDSDVYKVLEGVAYSLSTHPDPQLEARLERILDLIAKSQQPDGYLNTWFTLKEPDKRFTDLPAKHELYCAGHMFEAAVAHYHATGRRTFLDVACKLADHIDGIFGPGKRHAVAGHEEIELALVKLWRATGEKRYLDLARFFVDEHGRSETHELYGPYCQDHKPIAEQTEPVGHAVRWLYLFSAVADIAALEGNPGYVKAMETLWDTIVSKKMYITGGVGVQGHGEGFAREYYLPSYDAYCETCASIGMAFWNHRLALLHGEGRYADLVERVFYNGALSGVALDGAKFFYVNPLASRGDHHRQSWFGCACCPTNVVRFVAALGDYVYAGLSGGDGACVLQYVPGSGTIALGEGSVRLTQETRYPWDGKVRITVDPEEAGEFTVRFRIPGWCRGATVSLNGKPVDPVVKDGFAAIRRVWKAGDRVTIDLPMPVTRVASDPRVEESRGRLAVMRGPIVYCLEDVDNPCRVDRVAIPGDATFQARRRADLLGGVTTLSVEGVTWELAATEDASFTIARRPVELTLVPYYAWDNREPGRMVVWTPTELPEAPDMKDATVAVIATPEASHCCPRDTTTALNDTVLPESSGDHDVPRFTWWGRSGTREWVGYRFERPVTVSKAEVYWFDDTGRGSCRVPASWRLLWLDGSEWKPVNPSAECGVAKDTFNRIEFDPVTTRGLRIEAQLRPGVSGGILEWRLPK